jgi:hypothetical protein
MILMQVAPEVAMQMGIGNEMMAAAAANQPSGGRVSEEKRGSLSAQAANATKESTAPRS